MRSLSRVLYHGWNGLADGVLQRGPVLLHGILRVDQIGAGCEQKRLGCNDVQKQA